MRRLMVAVALAMAVAGCAELGIDAGQLADLQSQLSEAQDMIEQAQAQVAADQQEFEEFWESQGMDYQGPANTDSPNRPPVPTGGETDASMEFDYEGTNRSVESTTYNDPFGPDFDSLADTYNDAYGHEPKFTETDPYTGWRRSYWENGNRSTDVEEGPTGVVVTSAWDS